MLIGVSLSVANTVAFLAYNTGDDVIVLYDAAGNVATNSVVMIFRRDDGWRIGSDHRNCFFDYFFNDSHGSGACRRWLYLPFGFNYHVGNYVSW